MIKMTEKLSLAKNKEFKIDLFDLEDSRFYIKLNDGLIDKIKSNIKINYNSIVLFSEKLNLPHGTLYGWLYKKEFPLSTIKLLKKELGISEKEIKSSIIHIRSGLYPYKGGGNLSRPISPKFPIRLNEELVRIISHIFGDGTLSIDYRNYVTLSYYNQNKFLINQFIKDSNKIFNTGKLDIKLNKTTPYVNLPTPVALILLYKIKEFNNKKCRVPSFIKDANQILKIEFLRSFFDDEAYVRYAPPHRYIEVALSNKYFIKDLKRILGEFEISIPKIYHRKIRGFDIYYFHIKSYYNLQKYYEKIGFNNPNKQRLLKKIIRNPGKKSYLHGETKGKIVKLLKERKLVSSQIAERLDRKLCTINHFLNILEKEKKITYIGKKKKYKLYKVI